MQSKLIEIWKKRNVVTKFIEIIPEPFRDLEDNDLEATEEELETEVEEEEEESD